MLLSTGASLVSFSFFEIRSALQSHALRGVASAPLQLASLVPLFVALVCVGAKESLYRLTYAVGKRYGSQSLIANAHHHRSDMLSSIAAALGIVGTLAGVPWLEPLAVFVVGGLVLRVGLQTLLTVRIKMPQMPALRPARS
eukprot:1131808-Pleurochrysis_carterae.AAC.4